MGAVCRGMSALNEGRCSLCDVRSVAVRKLADVLVQIRRRTEEEVNPCSALHLLQLRRKRHVRDRCRRCNKRRRQATSVNHRWAPPPTHYTCESTQDHQVSLHFFFFFCFGFVLIDPKCQKTTTKSKEWDTKNDQLHIKRPTETDLP